MTCSAHSSPGTPGWLTGLRLVAVVSGVCLSFLACSSLSYEEGAVLDVDILHHTGRSEVLRDIRYSDGDVRGLITQEGRGVVLEHGTLVLGSIQLVACEQASRQLGRLGDWFVELRRFGGWLSPVSSALAHRKGSALVHGTPIIFDLMAADRVAQPVARMAPPPGSYCALRVSASAADDDAPGIEQAPEMLGRTMVVSGRYSEPDTAGDEGFELDSSLEHRVVVEFDQPLWITMDGPTARVLIDLDYGALLNGVDPSSEEVEVSGFLVIRNLLQGITVHGCTTVEACAEAERRRPPPG